MHDPSTVPGHRAPWRALILDRSDPDDPRWIIFTVATAGDVRPAVMDGIRWADWPEVAEWAASRVGGRVRLVPVTAVVWRIDAEDAG